MHNLPFQVGQLAEFKSFEDGFRGAWFRCKIKEMTRRKGQILYLMEYIDYPDEELKWEEIYQKPPLLSTCHKGKVTSKELMLRPSFPSIYHPSRMPDISTSTEVFVVVDHKWKVGDYVDWWTDHCYWSGIIAETLGDKKVKLDLFPPPDGEGGSHEVHSDELRPFLIWSPENGWMLPKYQDSKNRHARIRIVKPLNSAEKLRKKGKQQRSCVLGLEGRSASFSSHISGNSITLPSGSEQTSLETSDTFDVAESPIIDGSLTAKPMIGKSSSQRRDSFSHFRDAPTKIKGAPNTNEVRCVEGVPSKKIKVDESISLNSTYSETLEASMLNLEELVNKVKWMRGILEFGPHFPSTIKPSWQYSPHRA